MTHNLRPPLGGPGLVTGARDLNSGTTTRTAGDAGPGHKPGARHYTQIGGLPGFVACDPCSKRGTIRCLTTDQIAAHEAWHEGRDT